MSQQDSEIGRTIAQIAALSLSTAAEPTVKQLRVRPLIGDVAHNLTYPVATGSTITRYPAIFNNHPTKSEIEGAAIAAASIEGDLSHYGHALSTFLSSVEKIKTEGPTPGKPPLAGLEGRAYRLFENTEGGNGWDHHYMQTSHVLARAWSTGDPSIYEAGVEHFSEKLWADTYTPAMSPEHASRRDRNNALRDVVYIFQTSRNSRRR